MAKVKNVEPPAAPPRQDQDPADAGRWEQLRRLAGQDEPDVGRLRAMTAELGLHPVLAGLWPIVLRAAAEAEQELTSTQGAEAELVEVQGRIAALHRCRPRNAGETEELEDKLRDLRRRESRLMNAAGTHRLADGHLAGLRQVFGALLGVDGSKYLGWLPDAVLRWFVDHRLDIAAIDTPEGLFSYGLRPEPARRPRLRNVAGLKAPADESRPLLSEFAQLIGVPPPRAS